MANTTGQATPEEIDSGWDVELEERRPASGFEQAYWEQVEGKVLLRRFGENTPAPAPLRRKRVWA